MEQKCLELLRENETSIWAEINGGKRSSHFSNEYVVTMIYPEKPAHHDREGVALMYIQSRAEAPYNCNCTE